MYLSKTLSLKIYDTKIQFVVTPKIVKTVNTLYKKHNIDLGWTDAPAGCIISLSINKYHIIISDQYITYNTILHELYHLIKTLTFDRGIFEEEAQAWIYGLVGQEIFNFLNLKKVKIG